MRALGRACLAAITLCTAAQADTLVQLGAMSLDSLLDVEVTAASKFTQSVGESASSASIIGAAEIRALGFRTLADALASMRGLNVNNDRIYSYLGVRGMSAPGDYNTRVLLLIDGVRVNDGMYDQAALGNEFPLDLDVVERIEFIPGQGSAVHGANALFGVVNVVTRRGAAQNEGHGWAELGSGRARTGSALLNLVGEQGRALMLSATVTRSEGRSLYYAGFDRPETNDGVSRGADGERSEKLLLKLDAGSGVAATLIYANRAKGIPAAADTVFASPVNQYRDTYLMASIELDRPLGEATDLKTRLYSQQYRFRGDYEVDYAPDTQNVDRARADRWGLEAGVVTRRFASHTLAMGADLQAQPRRDQSNADITGPRTTYLDDHRSSRRIAFHAEDRFELSPRLGLTAGGRYDRESGEGHSNSAFSPRLAAVFNAGERTIMKYIYGSAFRPANAYESYFTVPGPPDYKANPNLHHETVHGHELALEHRPDGASRWHASVYSNQARNLIVQTVDPADGMLVFRNRGSLRTRGVELEGERVLDGGTRLRANLSIQRAAGPADLESVNVAPRELANLMAIVPAGPWTVGLHTALIGRRGNAAGYGVTHVTLTTSSPWQGWDAAFSVYDIFDRSASDPGRDAELIPTVPRDGRTLRLRLERRF
jgi:outer membrane receptor protein involved in Fe transport